MRDFEDISSFAAFLEKVMLTMPVAQHQGLDQAAAIIQAEAKREIGEYQDAVGPFEEWQELADFTKQDRVAQGFPENEPLLRTGALRESIERSADASTAYVGSDSQIAEWQELGTEKIPPRSFLGGAAARKGDEAVETFAQVIVRHIEGVAVTHLDRENHEHD